MADNAVSVSGQYRLADGRMVTIRPVRAEDAERMSRFLTDSSGETRYRRFHKWVQIPTGKIIQYMTEVDYNRHLSLVCTVPSNAGEKIVGEAGYVVNADGRSCEFDIMIEDTWQRTGIAGLLMALLIRAARQRGLAQMDGLVLSSNLDMLRFARALGFETHVIPEDPTTTRIDKKLDATPRREKPA
jgi:acetyltransferase